jgi:hypothetical protein
MDDIQLRLSVRARRQRPLVIIGAVVVALAVPLYIFQLRRRYWIYGDQLIGPRRGIRLSGVRSARVHRHHRMLAITMDGFRLYLGDQWIPNYYEPAGLRALADGLARSPSPESQDAAWLRRFADDPRRRMWPWP